MTAEQGSALNSRQALHAALLSFDMPQGLLVEYGESADAWSNAARIGSRICVSSPMPEDIRALLDRETERRINNAVDRCRMIGGLDSDNYEV